MASIGKDTVGSDTSQTSTMAIGAVPGNVQRMRSASRTSNGSRPNCLQTPSRTLPWSSSCRRRPLPHPASWAATKEQWQRTQAHKKNAMAIKSLRNMIAETTDVIEKATLQQLLAKRQEQTKGASSPAERMQQAIDNLAEAQQRLDRSQRHLEEAQKQHTINQETYQQARKELKDLRKAALSVQRPSPPSSSCFHPTQCFQEAATLVSQLESVSTVENGHITIPTDAMTQVLNMLRAKADSFSPQPAHPQQSQLQATQAITTQDPYQTPGPGAGVGEASELSDIDLCCAASEPEVQDGNHFSQMLRKHMHPTGARRRTLFTKTTGGGIRRLVK